MTGLKRWVPVLLLGVLMVSSSARALEAFDYPELSVVPRATDRLHIEASRERGQMWTTYLPIQFSSALTLANGIAHFDPLEPGPGYAAAGVGAGWLVLTTALALAYHPYVSGYREVSTLPKGGSVREQLGRERAAESEINDIASLGKKLTWLSVASNLLASIYAEAKGKSRVTVPGSTLTTQNYVGQTLGIISILGSVAPLLFQFHWNEVANEQQEYKKKIYAPVARTGVLPEPGQTGRFVPALFLSFYF